jgi:hypothetical protein
LIGQLTSRQADDLKRVVLRVAASAEMLLALERVYESIGREVAARRPRCDRSGRCCRFEQNGHLLFVSGLEIAVFAARIRTRPPDRAGGCAWQADGACTAHTHRPTGCRIYYCDPASTAWQGDLYERHHRQIVALHHQFDLPYIYGEWREMIAIAMPPGENTAIEKSSRLRVLPDIAQH